MPLDVEEPEEEDEEDEEEDDNTTVALADESSDDESSAPVDARLQPNTIDSAENIGAAQIGDKLDPDILNEASKAEQEMALKEAQLDEEIRKNQQKQEELETIKKTMEMMDKSDVRAGVEAIQEEDEEDNSGDEENQKVDEAKLMDKKSGEFVIFKDGQKEEPQKNLEPSFEKLNYVNKINILLKALMIERNRNNENAIKMQVLRREYTSKVKFIQGILGEKDQLIDKVVEAEVAVDKKQEYINYMKEKQLADKIQIEKLTDKCKSLELFMAKNAETQQNEAQMIEERIDKRVMKLVEQERALMKQQKRVILDKQKLQEQKIVSLKAQLKEAKQMIIKYK